ncbi:MAG: TonB-dependent receptor, partial [Bacteroidales bacterium]|nr:TonB-dependent receptor [Bacteroidales bacterium]
MMEKRKPTVKNALALVLWILTSIFHPVNGQTQAGDEKIQLRARGESLESIIKRIETQVPFTFVYNSSMIDMDQTMDVDLRNLGLSESLDKLLAGKNISYTFRDNHIVLSPFTSVSEITKEQPVTINGIISDIQGTPLVGVNVYIKGTTTGTITSFDGSFSIRAEIGQTLVFSYVGYENKEFKIQDERRVNLVLQEEARSLEEVIVIGYGSESRALLSSSVGSVNAGDIVEAPSSTFSGALQGRTAGIQVVQNSGTPGAGISVRVRGTSSINAGAEPLYVIDGVPMITRDLSQIGFSGQGVNSISDLNPNDIESISILKDASATAIYGARGSNGVVLITTKMGKLNENRINFNASYGLQKVIRKVDLLNASEFMEMKNNASINDGGLPLYSQEAIENPAVDTDWLDQIFQTAPIQNYDLSFSGGNEKSKYYLSGSYFDQEGIVLGTDFSKISGRVNLDQQVTDKFSIGTNFGVTRSINNRKEGDQSLNGPVPNALSLPSIFPVYNADGSYNESGPYANPVSVSEQQINEAYSFRALGNFYLEYEILPGLSLNSKLGYDFVNYREHSYDPTSTRQGSKYNGVGLESTSEAIKTLFSNVLTYDFDLGKNAFSLLGGVEFEQEKENITFSRAQDYASPDLQNMVSAATPISASADSYFRYKLNSYIGRLRINRENKYLFTFSTRYDGSSKFGPNNKYGFFPSGDVAWRISEEDFFPKSMVSDLKIRASYGITGNDLIPSLSYLDLYSPSSFYLNQPGISISQIPNPNLKWEATAQSNLGIDIGFFSSRINLNMDLYKKTTDDLLLYRPIPTSTGFSGITDNIGRLENKGLEINLTSDNLTGSFTWTTGMNIAFNKNKVLELYNNQPVDDLGRGGNRLEEGEPIGIFYGWRSLGVDPSTGDIVFDDVFSDGIIDSRDRTKIGDPNPVFTGGLTNQLSWKGLALSFFFQYSYGND